MFNSLDPNEAKKWRDKKWMQIADTEEEKIPEQIKLVHNAIEKERKLQEQKEKEKELNDRKGDLLEEMKRRFEVLINCSSLYFGHCDLVFLLKFVS